MLLAAGGVPLSRDRLIDELWGERPPPSAVSALHVHLSKLRALLGDLLALTSAGYALTPGAFELDAWRFDALVQEAREQPERAASLLREALNLFRGEPLCDVAADGSIGQWRRALEEKRMGALLARIDADLAAGAGAELVAELGALAERHPFEERAWGQLMLALHRAGRQADALDAYQRARRRFADELGLDPGEALAALQRQILARDPSLIAPAPGASVQAPGRTPGAAAATAGRSSLPHPPTRLLGREHDLSALDGLMADPNVRLLTLTGPGGVGKTRLLLALARAQEAQHRDGAVFVALEQLTDPALVPTEIAAALAARDGGDGPSPDGLTGYLRERELLLVIDSFEHVLDAAVAVAELLARAPQLRVLVSSRIALRLRGEHVFEVAPLALPAGEGHAQLTQSPAVALFTQRALAADRTLTIDGIALTTVATICRALDGLPLAIELAASRAQSLSPDEIAGQLAAPLTLGQRGLRDLPARQQTLQATINWSYRLLSAGAREALQASSVFLGGFTLPALDAVLGRPAGAELEELLEASLARRGQLPGRYELLALVRAFGGEQLARSGTEARAVARHRGYYAALVAPAGQAFDRGDAPGEIAAPLVADHPNLRLAFDSALQAGDAEGAIALARGLRALWLAGMLRQESQEIVERLLEALPVPAEAEVALLRAAAFIDTFGSAPSVWNRRLFDRASELGDQDALVTATCNLFGQALNAHDIDEMRRLRPTLVALIESVPSAKTLGWLHYFLALEAYVEGRFEASAQHASLSAEHARASGHDFMLASVTGTRLLAQSARDAEIPLAELAAAIEVMRRPGVKPLAAFGLWLVARYAAGVAPASAGQWLAHAERILIELGVQIWPESVLRDETMVALGLTELEALLSSEPALDHVASLAAAAAWLAERDGSERAPRPGVGALAQAELPAA